MNAAKKEQKSERRSRKGNIIGLNCLRGSATGRRERQREGTMTARKRGNERILIRNLKNKIIRLPDSKCQLRKGSRWRERDTHTHRKKGRGRREKEEKRNIQKETGGAGVMETPSQLPPGGRKTIFRMLRSNTSPGKIFPISHWRETEPPGQEGESSYDGVYVCAA